MYIPHVIAMDVGQKFKVTTTDQTTHNIHPLPAPGTGNIGWNKSQPPGAPPIETSWKAPEGDHGEVQHSPLDAWLHVVVKGPYAITDENGSYTINNVPPGILHGDCLAGELRNSNPESDRGCRTAGESRFHL